MRMPVAVTALKVSDAHPHTALLWLSAETMPLLLTPDAAISSLPSYPFTHRVTGCHSLEASGVVAGLVVYSMVRFLATGPAPPESLSLYNRIRFTDVGAVSDTPRYDGLMALNASVLQVNVLVLPSKASCGR